MEKKIKKAAAMSSQTYFEGLVGFAHSACISQKYLRLSQNLRKFVVSNKSLNSNMIWHS